MTTAATAPTPCCRACGAPLTQTVVDLGLSPVSNAFIRPEHIAQGEMFYPLHAMVCHKCWLVQLRDATPAETHFHDNYVYFSSFSTSWLEHARRYVTAMTERFDLTPASSVMELASNDGYLLQYFHQNGVPCLGIEPSANTGEAALAEEQLAAVDALGARCAWKAGRWTCCSATTCWPTCRTSTTSWAACRSC